MDGLGRVLLRWIGATDLWGCKTRGVRPPYQTETGPVHGRFF